MSVTSVQGSAAFFSPGSVLVGEAGGIPASGTTGAIPARPDLTQDMFEDWDFESQQLYIMSNGRKVTKDGVDYKVVDVPFLNKEVPKSGTKYSIYIQPGYSRARGIEDDAVGSAGTSIEKGRQSLLPAAATLSPATFQSWPRDQQMLYVKSVGTGSPKTIYFGAEASYGVRSVELVMPNDIDTLRLSGRSLGAGGVSEPEPLNVSWGNFESTTTWTEVPSGVARATPNLGQITRAEFQTWTKKEQILYITTHGQGVPPVLLLYLPPVTGQLFPGLVGATISNDTTSAGLAAANVNLNNNPAANGAGSTRFSLPDTERLTPGTFLTWTKQDQSAYVELYGHNKGNGVFELTFAPQSDPSLTSVVFTKSSGGGVLSLGASTGLSPTAGELLPNAPNGESAIPYFNLLGSAGDTGSGAFNKANAEALFPTRDGVTHTLPASDRPAGFATAPTSLTTAAAITAFIADFGTWHSGFQVEYVNTYGTGTPKTLEIPASAVNTTTTPPSYTVIPVMTALLSSDTPTHLIRVEALTKADFATMALADQTRVTATPAWAAYQQTKVGLSTNKAAITANIDSLIRDAKIMFGVTSSTLQTLVPGSRPTYSDTPYPSPVAGKAGSPEEEYAKIFTDELDLLKTKLSKTAVISVTDVQKQIDDLEKRLIRAYTFWDSQKESVKETTRSVWFDTFINDYAVPDRVVSLDGGAVIKGGFDTFIAQERRLRDLAQARYAVATDAASGASFNGKHFDAATLIYFFQDKYNSELEAQVNMETEYVKQVNDLLKTYAAMQQSISTTLGAFGTGTTDTDTRYIDNKQVYDFKDLVDNNHDNAAEYRLARLYVMFDDSSSIKKHPIELLEKTERPTQDLVKNFNDNHSGDITNWDFNPYTSSQWQTFATKVDNAVTQLNQESQLRMNEINNKDKERNRHYDLANNALSKMNEALQSILRAS